MNQLLIFLLFQVSYIRISTKRKVWEYFWEGEMNMEVEGVEVQLSLVHEAIKDYLTGMPMGIYYISASQ